MKKLYLVALLLFPFLLQAQITITADDFPQAGDIFISVNCEIPPAFDFGSPGANQTYDFSMLTPTDTFTNSFVSPIGTGGSSEFPNATLAVGTPDDGFGYYQQNSNEFLVLGFYVDTSANGIGQYAAIHYNPASKLFEIPTTYNTSFTNMSSYAITMADGSGTFDSTRFNVITEADVLFDGYGTLITPNGSFDALRERRFTTTTLTVEAYFFGTWTPLFTSTETDTSYNWVGDNNLDLASVSIFNGGIANISYSLNGVTLIAPVADFTSEDFGGGTISFTDNSSNIPTSWFWDFGDGSTSTAQNPEHTYSAPGDYTVCLTASNSAGSDMTCMTVSVSINLSPVAAFTYAVVLGGAVEFTDVSTNDPTSWFWDFGDGNTSTEQNPQHFYSTSGDYTVCLFVANNAGSDMTCQTVSVSIINTPVAAFTYTVQSNGVVDFTDASANNPTSWFWDFGDGNTSTEQNPQHIYNTSGAYTVCLTATNTSGSNTACETVDVMITAIDDLENLVNVGLFPNPATDVVMLQLENAKQEMLVFQLRNALGQLVISREVASNGSYEIDLENVAAGMYYYTFQDSNGLVRKRGSLIKN
jgi:PKD repeat protein